ncbi:phosphatase PAP2 family protein [Sphingomonas sp.]|uniref:phosphatase PAP2 family protein n=1 Tax=Sphingomonas sp. TaxID=28214 RepID=UPI002ED99431
MTAPRGAKRAGRLERADAALGAAAAQYRNTRLVGGFGRLAEIADQPPLIAIGAVTAVVGAALRKPRLLRTGLRMLASEIVATGAKALVKHHVARKRPGKMLADGRYSRQRDRNGDKDRGPWNSFPSGHTAGAFAVGRALAREYPAATPVVGGAVALIALAQPLTGAHFPSDVAAGAAIGLASEAVVNGVVKALT